MPGNISISFLSSSMEVNIKSAMFGTQKTFMNGSYQGKGYRGIGRNPI